MRFARFLKRLELKLLTYRDGFQVASARKDKFGEEFVERTAIIIIHPNTAKTFGFKDGQIVRVKTKDRSIRVRLTLDEIAPENCALMPKSIYTNYLNTSTVVVEAEEGEVTKPQDILNELVIT